ncbi:CPCC family cysteine-rich protein [Anaeromyxobacter sp. Red801]|uniref:CPCC family cysteine-rich protein n=1 Tax=Anaeromyxobacter sp. Red801 TaxID=3411632 RepID=UPI003B9ED76A
MASDDAEPLLPCPCCGYATLSSRGSDEICPICFWEDDGQDDDDADDERGGPNRVSLTAARLNFLRIGVAELENRPHVRAPSPTDRRVRAFVLEDGRVVDRTDREP